MMSADVSSSPPTPVGNLAQPVSGELRTDQISHLPRVGGGSGAVATRVTPNRPKPNLLQVYEERAVSRLTKQFEYVNPMQVPRIEKVTVNIGIGEAKDNPR